MDNDTQKPGALYMEALQARDAALKSVVPSEQNDNLQKSNEALFALLEQIALFAAPTSLLLDGVIRKVSDLQKSDPDAYLQVAKLFGDKIALGEGILCTMPEEFEFVRNYSNMVRDTIARQHGIDPKDTAAVAELLIRVGNEFVLKRPSPHN